jgi:hypothetical protein
MNERRPIAVLEAVPIGLDSIFMVDFEAFPRPSIVGRANIGKAPLYVVKHALQRTGKRQLAQFSQALAAKWRGDHPQGLQPLTVRDVLPLQQKKRESKHMVSVHMSDENGSKAGNILSTTTQSSQRSRRSVDDVGFVKHCKGMMAPMWQEGIARSEHVNPVCHASRRSLFFFFSSVGSNARRDVKSYQ